MSGLGSESESEGNKGWKQMSGRKRGRAASRGAAAGPPVDGALARVDVWPADCDIHGEVTGKVVFLASPFTILSPGSSPSSSYQECFCLQGSVIS